MRRDGHQAGSLEVRTVAHDREQRRQLDGRDAVFARLAGHVHLDVAAQRGGRATSSQLAFELERQSFRVERVQRDDVWQHLAHLVALQMADEVPARL